MKLPTQMTATETMLWEDTFTRLRHHASGLANAVATLRQECTLRRVRAESPKDIRLANAIEDEVDRALDAIAEQGAAITRIAFTLSPAVPPNEVHFLDARGHIIGKIINLDDIEPIGGEQR